jgi:hypothetical protein
VVMVALAPQALEATASSKETISVLQKTVRKSWPMVERLCLKVESLNRRFIIYRRMLGWEIESSLGFCPGMVSRLVWQEHGEKD